MASHNILCFGLALHVYSRSARAPLLGFLVAACAWPSSPASAHDLKPPPQARPAPAPASLPDHT
eukprot:3774404-Pleurochrysis_carterae.AAC.1